MDNHAISVFLNEVATQCGYTLSAAAQVNNALKALNQDTDSDDNLNQRQFLKREVFRGLHSLLTHASNISRILWPPSGNSAVAKRRANRGIALRHYLDLPDNGHPLKERTLRDHLEHFDERLDDWAGTSIQRNFIQDSIGAWGALPSFDEGDVMRWFDPSTLRFIFRGQSFDIQIIVSEIAKLLPIAEAASKKAWYTP
jgi:hypothetical protein